MFPGARMLHNRGIRQALSKGWISTGRGIYQNQIQPATLDVRIGKVKLYGQEAQANAAAKWNKEAERSIARISLVDQIAVDPPALWAPTDLNSEVIVCRPRRMQTLLDMIPEEFDKEPTDEFARVIPDEEDIPIQIEPMGFAEVYLHENLKYDPSRVRPYLDLRSSMGRLQAERWQGDCASLHPFPA